ncbi:MAG: diguanylate cyclase [Chloroflexi bacterium RBG_19FT_COMBO_47_9]|nr:MAG: diguanylate cyclase [Chloroflexi bacterium RBG_16_47_49]OGO59985.1 MAG: diguanylate cyclase [Chloroflexi bacterium RBG_19FT_COMBO_47_9]
MYRDIFKRFVKRKPSIYGGTILILFLLMALIGPFLVKYEPTAQDLHNVHAGISRDHLLGTDYLGRDLLSRVVYGARISMFISFAGVAMGSIIGILLGLISGYYGGVVDNLISRLLEIMLAFPGLLIAIFIVAILGTGTFNTMIAISFYVVPSLARIVRSSVISIKNNEYVQVCDVFGASRFRILFKHVLPNSLSLLIVNVTHSLGIALLTASSLSFLGLGVQPPYAEWGAMLSSAREALRINPIEALAPGVAITLVVLSFSVIGDGLSDALDPRLKNS